MEEFIEFLDYVYENPYNFPSRRYLRDAQTPLELYSEEEFKKRFRFRKDTVVQVLLPLLSLPLNENNRGKPIPPIIQLLIALRFYATGIFQIVNGDLLSLSQPVVCKIVKRISRLLAYKVSQFVKFPEPSELPNIKRQFYQQSGFPGVIGCIDCTHIPIKNPSRENGEAYRNRKGFFSINVQLVCGPDMKIYDVVARWPGSAHDSRIFVNSRCCLRFEEGNMGGLLLGDSGYAQTSYMFTPVINPQTSPQRRYNSAHINTRNIIERLNGLLKRCFSCLSRTLQNRVHNVPNIIVACTVLHNISISTNEQLPEPLRVEPIPVSVINDDERGSIIRAAFIERHFA